MDVVETARGRRGRFSRWIPFRTGALAVLGCSLAALLAGSAGAVDPTFTQPPGSPIATGSGAISVVAANLNGAGGLDLAVANQGAGNVSILSGNGNGTFGGPTNFAVGTDPVSVVAADLDGAGGLDLAVANENATGVGSVSILLGNGSGGFSPAAGSPVTTGPVGSAPQGIAVGRLDSDAILDLAVVNENDPNPGNVSILLGNGSGGFSNAAGSPVTVGSLPQSIAAGHFNGDAFLDLAVANEGTNNVSILFGNGLGGFPTSSTVAAGSGPSDIGTALLNADVIPDLVVANATSNDVTILFGNGSGGFPTSSTVAVVNGPEGTAAADFNGDGKLDLAVSNTGLSPAGNLTILLGNGMGVFTASGSTVPAGGAPTTVASADLNGDSKPDLAVANYDTGNLTVQLNTTSPPTAVALSNFVARATPKGVRLQWRTAHESGLIGFHVYRSGVKLNRTLIAARGSGAAGAAYRLLDRRARIGAVSSYHLQAVRTDGTRAWLARASTKR